MQGVHWDPSNPCGGCEWLEKQLCLSLVQQGEQKVGLWVNVLTTCRSHMSFAEPSLGVSVNGS